MIFESLSLQEKKELTSEQPTGGPLQLFIPIAVDDIDDVPGSLAVPDGQLGLRVPESQDLEAVGVDGEKLGVLPLEEGHHLLDPAGGAHGRLGALLVLEQLVQSGRGVEDYLFRGRSEEFHEQGNATAHEQGHAALGSTRGKVELRAGSP